MARMSGVVLPKGSKYLRRPPKTKVDDATFMSAFDQNTLFYDVFFTADTNEITVVAPSLKTQKALLDDLVVKVDGIKIDPISVEFISPRTNQFRFASPTSDPKTLRVLHKGPPKLNAQVAINRADLDRFAGTNALVAISKNNKLEWLQDWLRYYVGQHRANAVVLIDNGSDAYRLKDLHRAVASVSGITAFEVLSAPYPFGPKAVDRMSVNSKFLHLSALHVAHHRFLKRANAVLSVDIDELVTKPGEETVFEAVKRQPTGLLSIKGVWRYAKPPRQPSDIVRHADHILQRIGPDTRMQPKWCIDPTGPLAGRYWKTHGIVQAKRNYAHPFHYLHCRQITTNWDYDRDFEPDNLFETSPEAEQISAAFNAQSR